MIRPATPQDVGAIAEYLTAALKGSGGPRRYRSMLEYSWFDPKPDLGVLIEDGGRIRGFIGAIYARRTIAGRDHMFCNLTSISVDESHRKQSLQLFAAILGRKDLTFTSFSASEQVRQILDFFKFVHCANERVVTTPLSGMAALSRAVGARRPRVVIEPSALDTELAPTERRIAADHRRYRCGQFLLISGDRRCFAVTVRRGRGRRVFADVLYASDPPLLMECLPWVHATAFRFHRTVLLGVDRRWIPAPPRLAFIYTRLRPIYMRSPHLSIEAIDPLYTEIVPMYASGGREAPDA
jgi:acetoacetyl-CoA synthetase